MQVTYQLQESPELSGLPLFGLWHDQLRQVLGRGLGSLEPAGQALTGGSSAGFGEDDRRVDGLHPSCSAKPRRCEKANAAEAMEDTGNADFVCEELCACSSDGGIFLNM